MEETDKILKGLKATVSTACPIVDKSIETARSETYIPAIVSQGKTKEADEQAKQPEVEEVNDSIKQPEIQEVEEQVRQPKTDDTKTLFTHDTIEAVLRRKREANLGQISSVAKRLRTQQPETGREPGE